MCLPALVLAFALWWFTRVFACACACICVMVVHTCVCLRLCMHLRYGGSHVCLPALLLAFAFALLV